jgi:hypothetical protein
MVNLTQPEGRSRQPSRTSQAPARSARRRSASPRGIAATRPSARRTGSPRRRSSRSSRSSRSRRSPRSSRRSRPDLQREEAAGRIGTGSRGPGRIWIEILAGVATHATPPQEQPEDEISALKSRKHCHQPSSLQLFFLPLNYVLWTRTHNP